MELDTGGATLRDMLPIPSNMDPDKHERANALGEEATISHALATSEHDVKGAAQEEHGSEVKDLGWTSHVAKIPNPVVGGLANDDLWVLVRRFDKVRSEYVKCVGGMADVAVANVSCQRVPLSRSWQPRSQYCRRRGILAGQAASQY